MSVDVSVVIPVYNEAVRIKRTLERTLDFLKKQSYTSEVIVVNDGSTDSTVEIVKSFPIILFEQPRNMGKGAAVKAGMLAATGKFRVFCDADLSTPIEELTRFLEVAKGADVVIASRAIKGSVLSQPQPWHRLVAGRVFSWIVQLLLIPGITDTQCGFKLFSQRAVDVIFPKQILGGWAFDVELLYIARKHGFKITEVPITWTNAEGSKLHLARDSYRMFIQVMKIRINAWAGKYK